MKNIFKNVLSHDNSDCMVIDLSQIDFISLTGRIGNGFSYTVALRSGAVIKIEAVGLLKAFNEYNKEKIIAVASSELMWWQ